MKRLIALLLTLLMIFTLCACTIGNKPVQETSAEVEDTTPDIAKYNKDFNGMQKYLVDMELIKTGEGLKSETKAEIVGAEKGVRYILDAESFVEFYEINTKATPDEAQKMYDGIKDGGTYDVLGLSKLKGVVSSSGKFIMLYPADSEYDYSKLIDEFKKF